MSAPLTRPQKAAIILGVMGREAAAPLLEQFDEATLRSFAESISRLKRVKSETVRATIGEFLAELDSNTGAVKGGVATAREMLGGAVNDATLAKVLEDLETPAIEGVWKRMAKVPETALAEFLAREHPQTAAVVLSKMGAEQAAKVLSKMEPDFARDIVLGITKTQSLDDAVIEAIGAAVSRGFMSNLAADTPRKNPAERVGAIMNYTSAEIRNHVLGHFETTNPPFAEEVKRKMFTFEDIPARLQPRDTGTVLRGVDNETLLKAMFHAQANMPEAFDFVLRSISTRVAEQIRADLREMAPVKKKEGEVAQSEVIRVIRDLVDRGDIRLQSNEEEEEE